MKFKVTEIQYTVMRAQEPYKVHHRKFNTINKENNGNNCLFLFDTPDPKDLYNISKDRYTQNKQNANKNSMKSLCLVSANISTLSQNIHVGLKASIKYERIDIYQGLLSYFMTKPWSFYSLSFPVIGAIYSQYLPSNFVQ